MVKEVDLAPEGFRFDTLLPAQLAVHFGDGLISEVTFACVHFFFLFHFAKTCFIDIPEIKCLVSFPTTTTTIKKSFHNLCHRGYVLVLFLCLSVIVVISRIMHKLLMELS